MTVRGGRAAGVRGSESSVKLCRARRAGRTSGRGSRACVACPGVEGAQQH